MSAPPDRPVVQLDDVSMAIIEQLQQDGRRSYAAIGKVVGLSEAAVRQRVQRLVEGGVMQIVAVTDPLELGFARQAMVGIRVVRPDPPGRRRARRARRGHLRGRHRRELRHPRRGRRRVRRGPARDPLRPDPHDPRRGRPPRRSSTCGSASRPTHWGGSLTTRWSLAGGSAAERSQPRRGAASTTTAWNAAHGRQYVTRAARVVDVRRHACRHPSARDASDAGRDAPSTVVEVVADVDARPARRSTSALPTPDPPSGGRRRSAWSTWSLRRVVHFRSTPRPVPGSGGRSPRGRRPSRTLSMR